ncbi:MAG: hypothetical protein OQK09_00560 [Colwellia sp.]|nr:hypothetical protein [Colwellia sp.]MCW8866521.1 hypothetical protein [Colwellia sp.]MCW9079979.1 hypothetical protein [Colwellia sp.]
MISFLQKVNDKRVRLGLFSCLVLSCYIAPWSAFAQSNQEQPKITEQQARALKMLNQQQPNTKRVKNLRIQVRKLSDNQGQTYLGAIVSRAELQPYLTQLKGILVDDFDKYRANQAARDHQRFHMTLIDPIEYQHVDKQLVEQLLSPMTNINFSSHLQVTLLGVGKVEKAGASSYFVVAQSNDAQLIRQRFLLGNKDFHVTLGFEPSDIYGVKKDSTTFVN